MRRRLRSVPGEDPESGVALAAAASEPRAEGRQHERLEVADPGDQRERGHDERREGDERRRPAARSASPDSTPHDLGRAECPPESAEAAAERLVPVVEPEADARAGRRSEQDRRDDAGSR